MKNLRHHFTQNASLESFADGEAAALDHTAASYAIDEAADGRARELLEDEIKHVEGDVTSLESLVAALEGERDIGLESESASYTSLTLAAIQTRYGIDTNEVTHAAMPSLECFDGRLARTATSLTLESVRNTLAIVQQRATDLNAQLAAR